MDNTIKSVLFPIFGSFPYILNFAISNKEKKSTDGKKILFVLDGTGSMGEYINELKECSKAVMAKKIIKSVIVSRPYNDYDIIVFNTTISEKCKLENIPEPNNATYFTPLVPEIENIFKNSNEYCSVIFISDGIPTEDKIIARDAICKIGNITRENNANPIAVAIGVDADGESCSLFAGNRGYNCFVKYDKEVENISKDIFNGIDCNYHTLENGSYVPVESDGMYYYVGEKSDGPTIKPTQYHIEKFLNLVIQKYINDPSQYSSLISYVKHVSNIIDDDNNRIQLLEKYTNMISMLKKTSLNISRSPAALSAMATVYRNVSSQV